MSRFLLRLLTSWLPLIVWTAIILSAANDSFSDTNTRSWLERMLGRDVPEFVNAVFRKGGHIVAYGILGLLAWRARRSPGVALFFAFAVACVDEGMQARTLTRGGSAYDVVLDTCAALLALICVPAVRARLSSRARAE
ncbi:MAG TPA: VanZ family protein [Thermoanaerobaculia bacterium]